ncbi:hypothetical protein A4G99_16610 [Haladaptatus sp. R4]|uniref:TasA family protein n=1 Tax=Haladaptatus sp. R4 TaxID=1679489 RepID=UPI0007B4B0A6|nr:TasA family protein [Haladaptatus sp. R4]KZN23119.1 hypothetical protein A4G99_16610 [Haladaptatus sp. R4]
MGLRETLFNDNRKTTFVALVLIGAVLLGFGTWALWSDTATVDQNTVSGGTFDLNVDGADSASGVIGLTEAAPGDTASHTFNLTNVGSKEADHVAMDLSFTENDSGEPDDSSLAKDLNGPDTAAMIEVTELSYDGTDHLKDIDDQNNNGIQDLADVQSQVDTLDDLAAPAAGGNDAKEMTLGLKVADDNGAFNGTDEDLMGDGVDITIDFTLNQKESQ